MTLDTTRVDHLSCYGYERLTSPRLDRLAEESLRYTRAWSTSAWTLPAHASLFTGLFPAAHGAQFDVQGEELRQGFRARRLADSFVTLAELLAERGYRTAAFVGGPWMTRRFGALQGFQTIDDEVPSMEGRRGEELTDLAAAWLGAQPPDEPLFLFVNYFDPHYPYSPPERFAHFTKGEEPLPARWLPWALSGRPLPDALRAELIARYDGEILAVDHELGRLLDAWRERSDASDSLVIVTSDHGESFGEGGFYLHNGSLGEEATRIPLIVHHSDGRGAGRVIDTPVQLVDLLPLVAAETGIALPPQVQGVLPGARDHAYLELLRNHFRVGQFGARYDRDLAAVIDWPHKLVVPEPGTPTLYRIDRNVGQEALEGKAGLGEQLQAALAAHRKRTGVAPDVELVPLDDETVDSLRALGYLD